ncbi:amidase [Corticibacter populi]|uniref:Amidase n=1 Tax=Corticibacter populi TaxID=1550736 RepID=A0A3M6QTM3_9BURK|nr:amidase [Corticibacter populi]RMX05909.1 amidase [Corticibacter populi]RZS30771.1 aspartyl-tRNA(Asn)/glutamyl-tRNA(Gln) amidotransferase subunit A [Corticibacter populi]
MTTSLERLEQCLVRIHGDSERARRIFTHLYEDSAREEAQAADARARHGRSLGPLDGRIVSVKDLLDVAGTVTTAGSRLLAQAPAARQDAAVVARLRAAGCVVIGKTNMTEFAFSGIGINPHFGTPGNARDATRIPGGSSSGAGVAVALGLCEIAVGSDTGGSVRIPAALNGVTGFKPSVQRVPREGAFPLSFSLDSIGPLAASVADCAMADAVMAGLSPDQAELPERRVRGLRIAVPRGLLFSEADAQVLQAFEQALEVLRRQGAQIDDVAWDEWLSAPFQIQRKGTLIAAEAAAIHQPYLPDRAAEYDPLVLARIERGMALDAASYIRILQQRVQLQRAFDRRMTGYDLVMLPTVVFTAPSIASLADEEAFMKANALALRNTSVFNFHDLPALSLPAPRDAQELPVGLMFAGARLADRAVLALGLAIERALHAA